MCCITNKEKAPKNEWENDDCDFLRALYSAYKNIPANFFQYFLMNIFKERYISCVKTYQYLKKLIK